MNRGKGTFVAVLGAWCGVQALDARASEAGSSVYLQGTYGDFGAGVLEPGFHFRNDFIYWEAQVGPRPLGGDVSGGINQQLWLDYLHLGWVGAGNFLGGHFGLTLKVPVLADGDVRQWAPGAAGSFDSTPRAGIGDLYLLPQVNWSGGSHHFTFGVGISGDTGRYKVDREVTAGRNYWAFDPQITYTFLNEAGYELTTTLGVLFNSENLETNYQTGDEMHGDVLLGKRWGSFGIAAVGHWYDQVSTDDQNVAYPPTQPGYQGRTWGAGAAVMKSFTAGNYEGMIIAKWLQDADTYQHLEGDLYMLSFAFKPFERPAPAPMPVAAVPPPAPPPPPPPAPPRDGDRDGVIDPNDLCPTTAPGDRVDMQGCSCDVTVRLLFGFDSAQLTPEDRQQLDSVLQTLRRLPQVSGEVAGYTDSRGTDAYNLELSRRRAQAVVEYLESRGIPASRLTAHGYGEADPIAGNDTEDGRRLNRRVVLRRNDCGAR